MNGSTTPTQPSPGPPTPHLPAWTTASQLAAAFLLGVATALLSVRVHAGWAGAARPLDRQPALPAYQIDLNTADHAELLQLPGVGPARAARLQAARQDVGFFSSPDDLLSVPGFGPATTDRLKPHLRGMSASDQAPVPPRSNSAKSLAPGSVINVNAASADELQKLPGVGPKMAQRIIDERAKKPFASIEELRRVYGIGPKTLEKLRSHVSVSGRRAAEPTVAQDGLPGAQ